MQARKKQGEGKGEGGAKLNDMDYSDVGPEDARRLPNADILVLRDMYYQLLCFANERLGIFPQATEWQDFRRLTSDDVREKLLTTPILFAEYCEENIKLSEEEKKHIQIFARHHIKDRFILWAYHPDGVEVVRVSNSRRYLIKGLTQPIEDILEANQSKLPVSAYLVVLPWKDMLVCDGLLRVTDTLPANVIAAVQADKNVGRPLIRSMDLSRPQPSASNTPKELADPDRFFTVLWSVWSNTRSSQWRQIDEGERQLVLEATAIKGSDPCYCNETPGALFQDCCRKKSSFAVVVQTPGSAGFRPMTIESIAWDVRNVDAVLTRLHERSEVQCTLANSDRVQWLYLGSPRAAKYMGGAEGLICYADLALNRQTRRLKLRTMSTARTAVVSAFLGALLKGCIAHPRKKCQPAERIEKGTRNKFLAPPTDEARQLPLCENCGAPGDKLALCSRCRQVKYCSKECQTADWAEHRAWCGVREQVIVRVMPSGATEAAPRKGDVDARALLD